MLVEYENQRNNLIVFYHQLMSEREQFMQLAEISDFEYWSSKAYEVTPKIEEVLEQLSQNRLAIEILKKDEIDEEKK